MYSSYAHPRAEAEDESVSHSGLSLVISSRGHERRMGRGRRGSGQAPVRIGSSVKKPAAARVSRLEQSAHCTVTDLNSKLADIEESEKKSDVSVSDLFSSLGINTPGNTGMKKQSYQHETMEASVNQDKISPDSGSFTMSTTKTRPFHHDSRDVDFTESLKQPMMKTQHNRMMPVKTGLGSGHKTSQAPVRISGARPLISSDKDQEISIIKEVINNKENVPVRVDSGMGASTTTESLVKEDSVMRDVIARQDNVTKDITARLHALAGDGRSLLETPRPNLSKQVTSVKESSSHHHHQPQYEATPMKLPQETPVKINNPPDHHHQQTPLPATKTPAQPRMPPPTATSSKERILIVRGKRYKVMKLLGKGGSSRVYEAFDDEKNIVVAIKRVDLSDADESQREGN